MSSWSTPSGCLRQHGTSEEFLKPQVDRNGVSSDCGAFVFLFVGVWVWFERQATHWCRVLQTANEHTAGDIDSVAEAFVAQHVLAGERWVGNVERQQYVHGFKIFKTQRKRSGPAIHYRPRIRSSMIDDPSGWQPCGLFSHQQNPPSQQTHGRGTNY